MIQNSSWKTLILTGLFVIGGFGCSDSEDSAASSEEPSVQKPEVFVNPFSNPVPGVPSENQGPSPSVPEVPSPLPAPEIPNQEPPNRPSAPEVPSLPPAPKILNPDEVPKNPVVRLPGVVASPEMRKIFQQVINANNRSMSICLNVTSRRDIGLTINLDISDTGRAINVVSLNREPARFISCIIEILKSIQFPDELKSSWGYQLFYTVESSPSRTV